jgi:hypothetical protein
LAIELPSKQIGLAKTTVPKAQAFNHTGATPSGVARGEHIHL